MKRVGLIVVLCGLLGCAGLPDDLAAAKASWRGASFEEVMKAWGPPARVDTLEDGAREATWVSEAYQKVRPSVGVVLGSGGGAVGANLPFGNAGPSVRCDRTLVFRGGEVAYSRWMGPYDYCNTFRR